MSKLFVLLVAPLDASGNTSGASVARSVEPLVDDVPVREAPDQRAGLRGALQLGSRARVTAKQPPGNGCSVDWYRLEPSGWVCGEAVRPSLWPASVGQNLPAQAFRYYRVGLDGALGYERLADAENSPPVSQLEPGFVVGLRRARSAFPGGELYGETSHGIWIPLRELSLLPRISFRGALWNARLGLGWALKQGAAVYERPNGRIVARLAPFEAIIPLAVSGKRVGASAYSTWVRIGEARWVRGRAVRWLRKQARPEGVGKHERWLHVDRTMQTLAAYLGDEPVFGTLVSTGRGSGRQDSATPLGLFRVWVKLKSTDMTNVDNDSAGRAYAIEDVPWVMFFKDGYGLHGAFWHQNFGLRQSHGCVNLSPGDAQFLFDWSGPPMPAGWRAVHPSKEEPGIWVYVTDGVASRGRLAQE